MSICQPHLAPRPARHVIASRRGRTALRWLGAVAALALPLGVGAVPASAFGAEAEGDRAEDASTTFGRNALSAPTAGDDLTTMMLGAGLIALGAGSLAALATRRRQDAPMT